MKWKRHRKRTVPTGTHVSGIIAPSNDKKGNRGVYDQAKIMVLGRYRRCDTQRYCGHTYAAIGAKVINTSFGKGYSPHKEWVWDLKYAEEKDVLIVNTAGTVEPMLTEIKKHVTDNLTEEIVSNF